MFARFLPLRAPTFCARRRALFARALLVAAVLAAAAFFLFGPHLLLHGPPPLPVLQRAQHASCACAAAMPDARADFSAVIVETRASPALVFAVRHMACTLPDDWPILLVAAPDMRAFVASNFSDLLESGRLRAWELAPDSQSLRRPCRGADGSWCVAAETAPPRRIPRAPAFSQWAQTWEVCNQITLSGALFAVLPSRQYLVFQTDGLLCRTPSPSYLAELSRFDYVGPPWSVHPGRRASVGAGGGVGGNGGFSFRTVDVLVRTIETEYAGRWLDEPLSSVSTGAEDVFFSERVEAVGGRLPPADFARAFAVETVPHAAPLGYHKPWWYMSPDEMRTLISNCPVVAESLAWARPLDAAWDASSIASCRQRERPPLAQRPSRPTTRGD